MKKGLVSVLSLFCSVALCIGVVGCDTGEDKDPAHEHTFASEWEKDATHHWYAATCEHTDEVKDKAEHTYNGDYGCTVCGYQHEHTFASEWEKDATHHWYPATCGHTDVKKSQTEHTFVGAICSVCGYSLSPTEGLVFTLSADETYYTVSGIGTATDTKIVIPSVHEEKPVKGIDTLAFEDCSTITEVIILDSVETIGNRAFAGCSGLTEMVIPDSVTSIGGSAFSGCSGLTSMTIPFVGGSATAETAGESTLFGYIFGTASYEDSEKTQQFYTGSQSKYYYIPSALRSVTITGGKILYGSFYCCDMLTDVVIGDDVESIGSSAFSFCYNLKNLTLGSGATVIGGYAFQDASLTNLVIPDNFQTIGTKAFHRCNKLMSVTLGNGLTTIYDEAFLGCYKLIEVKNLSDTLTIEMGTTTNGYAGKYAKNIYTASSGESKLTATQDGYVWYVDDVTQEYYLMGYLGTQTALTLPDTIDGNNYVVYDYAFYNRDELTSVVFGDGVIKIGDYAFKNCGELLSVTLGSGLEDIGTDAFRYCYKLIDVCCLSNTITNLEALRSEWWGYTGYYAKNLYNASGSSKLVTQGDYIFYADDATSEYYLLTYTGTEKAITLPNDVNGHDYEIYKYAFNERDDLTSITLSNGVTAIGDSAFFECDGLTSLTISSSVLKIGGSVFYGCNIANVQYAGTVAEWNTIVKDTNWKYNAPTFTVQCTDGNA